MAFLEGSKYRKSISTTGRVVSLTVYPGVGSDSAGVIYLNSYAHYFPNDITFTDSDGSTILNHWFEPGTNTVHVKTGDVLATKTIYIYFGLDGGNASKADPTDANVTGRWKRYASNPVLTVGAGGAWDDNWVEITSIVYDAGTYYFFYFGNRAIAGTNKIGLATSSDGDTLTKYGSNPIFAPGTSGQWDDASVGGFRAWKEGSTWYALYAGCQADGIWKMGLATASNPQGPWTRSASNPVMAPTAATWDSGGVVVGNNVYKEGSTYYMMYTGSTNMADASTWKLGLCSSTNLTTWAKDAGNPTMTGTGTPGDWNMAMSNAFLAKFGSTYYCYHYCQGELVGSYYRTRIGIASSAALSGPWTQAVTPIMEGTHTSADWDREWNENPWIVDFGTHWRMYYFAAPAGGLTPFQCGYAIYEKCGNGANVFPIFDDFSKIGVDAAKWTNTGTFSQERKEVYKTAADTNAQYILKSVDTIAYPCLISAKARVGDWANEYSNNFILLWDSAWATSGYYADHYKDGASDIYRLGRAPSGGSNTTTESIANETWYKLELRIAAAAQTFKVDGVQKGVLATTPPQASSNVILGTARGNGTSNYSTYYDFVFAREFDATEAVGTPGTQETIANASIKMPNYLSIPTMPSMNV